MWNMEIIKPLEKPHFKTALFDFDGTVSLIRSGWQEIMVPYFIEVLSEVAAPEEMEDIPRIVRDFVDILTGKQTIFQCMQLTEEVVKRGGAFVEPMEYKREYLRRLSIHTKDRIEGLKSGKYAPADMVVPGCIEFVNALKERGISCYLASGTDEKDVLYEASLLGLDKAFDGHIYGAHDYMTDCSKEMVINSLINEGKLRPEELISFGDGYVEIELVANIGGCLTPLGDPPLFLGFLRGVPFFWTAQHIWPLLLLNAAILLTVFAVLDSRYVKKEGKEGLERLELQQKASEKIKFKLEGAYNFIFLCCIDRH